MKALVARQKGIIWRTILFLPVSLLLTSIAFILQMILKSLDVCCNEFVKGWKKLNDTLDQTESALSEILLIILYLPFIILSLATITLLLKPLWYMLKPACNIICNANISLLARIQYRPAKPEEKEMVAKALESLKQKLKEQGLTDKQLEEMFTEPGKKLV